MQPCQEPKCFDCELCIAKPACRWCEYFVPEDIPALFHNELLDADVDCNGYCHCRPPQVGELEISENNKPTRAIAQWPLVHDFHWCGSFRERTNLINVSEDAICSAEEFITKALADGPVLNNQMRIDAIAEGVRMNALLLASRRLHINYTYPKDSVSELQWQLPDDLD